MSVQIRKGSLFLPYLNIAVIDNLSWLAEKMAGHLILFSSSCQVDPCKMQMKPVLNCYLYTLNIASTQHHNLKSMLFLLYSLIVHLHNEEACFPSIIPCISYVLYITWFTIFGWYNSASSITFFRATGPICLRTYGRKVNILITSGLYGFIHRPNKTLKAMKNNT